MGIQGLLPLLKSIMVPIHIKDLEGCTVAVDTYSWLHKGALSCSKELCKGLPTSKHISYCMHRVNLLRHHGITPILVFDGGHLPMKSEQENKRARSRKENLARAIEHESGGNLAAAYECYQKAVDISPSIAYELIQVLKEENVCYVVAPYEADAQMTFLAAGKQVDAVITEDSDLIPFGCPRIIYKMDKFGQGVEFQSSTLQHNKELNFTGFTKQMILEMCILSGCDYLQSLPGMGLKKAHALIKKFKSHDKVIKHLKYSTVAVPPHYEESFKKAMLTFQHQRVYDPGKEDLVHLFDLSDNTGEDMDFLGPSIPQHIANGIAKGDLDPFTKMPFQGECVRAAALVLNEISHTKTIKPEGERKKIDLPVQKNLLTNYFCFASLEAKRKFRVPRVTTLQPSLSNDIRPGEDSDETTISNNINCLSSSLCYSRNLETVDPTKNPVNSVVTKSYVPLESLGYGVDERVDNLRSTPCTLPHQSRHSINPCMVVNKEQRCKVSSDSGEGKMKTEEKHVTVKSSYFQHKSIKGDCLENTIENSVVKNNNSTVVPKICMSEFEYKTASNGVEGEEKLGEMNPIVRSSDFHIKFKKTTDQEKASGTLLIKNGAATSSEDHTNLIHEPNTVSDVTQPRTSRKVIVRSSYFQNKIGKENDWGNKSDIDGVATDQCQNSITESTLSGNKYLRGANTKRKFASDDNVQTEPINTKILRTAKPALDQTSGPCTSDSDNSGETKDEQDKFGCNISHLGQYSEIAEKSMEKFVSVISSFKYTSGSRASGLRAPLKDVRNTPSNRLTEAMDLSKFAYVPTKRKAYSASRR